MTISTIIIFLLVLGVIVFIHELGHFTTAKLFGVKVEEFGLGFPPKIYGKKKGETEYTLNWIPLGGFVKIAGEDGENRDDPRYFGAQPIWRRAIILAAGVAMNFLLAIVIFSAIFMSGFPTDVTGVDNSQLPAGTQSYVEITGITEGSPAAQAGIAVGDKVLKTGENEVQDVEDLQNYTKENAGENVTLTLDRQGKTMQKEVFSRENGNGQGAIGVSLARVAVIAYSPLEAVKAGFVHTYELTKYIFVYLVQTVRELVFTGGTTADVSGPIGMVSMTQQAAQMGFTVLLNFMALISVNLAIVNILPLPALDGGRIAFLLIEKIKRSPVSAETEAKIHSAGFAFLMLLMVVVTVQDIGKLGVWEKIMGMF